MFGRTSIYTFSIAKSLLCMYTPVSREFPISSLAPIGHGQETKPMENELSGVNSIHISETRRFLVQEYGSYGGSMRHE